MRSLRPASGFFVRLLIYYGVLAALWGLFAGAYASVFRATGGAVFVSGGSTGLAGVAASAFNIAEPARSIVAAATALLLIPSASAAKDYQPSEESELCLECHGDGGETLTFRDGRSVSVDVRLP